MSEFIAFGFWTIHDILKTENTMNKKELKTHSLSMDRGQMVVGQRVLPRHKLCHSEWLEGNGPDKLLPDINIINLGD